MKKLASMNHAWFAIVVAIGILGAASSAFATPQPGGTGTLFGANHAFNISAPEGWVLDTQVARDQGFYMVFYPQEQTWRDSPVIVYGRSATKTEAVTSIEGQVAATLALFRSDYGSPDIQAKPYATWKQRDDLEVFLYRYSGDRWGNHEVVGYIEEAETINFLVLNARTQEALEQAMPAFKQMLYSYRNLYASRSEEEVAQAFAQWSETAETQQLASPEYHQEVTGIVGTTMAEVMPRCVAWLSPLGPESGINLLAVLSPKGEVEHLWSEQTTALSTCVMAGLADVQFPPHETDGGFALRIPIQIVP